MKGYFFPLVMIVFGLMPSSPIAATPCTMDVLLLMPLTGPAASIGTDSMNAAKMAHQDLPEEIRSRVKLSFEDTQMKATTAVNAFKANLAKGKPDVVAVALSESTNAVAPLTGKENIVMFGVGPSRKFLENNPFAFRHWVDPEGMSPVLVAELKRRGIERVSVIYSEHPAQAAFADYFIPFANGSGLKIVSSASVLPEDADFRGVISQALAKKPEGIVYFVLPPQPSALTRQIRTLHQTIPLFAFINTESLTEIKNAQGAMEGVVYVGPAFSREFIDRFMTMYDDDYPEGCAGSFYDIVKILGEMVKENICSGDSLRSAVGSVTRFTGVAGTYGVQPSREFQIPVELREIRGGEIRTYRPN